MQHVELDRITEAEHRDDHATVPQGTDAEPRQGRIKAWTRAALRDVTYCGAVWVMSPIHVLWKRRVG